MTSATSAGDPFSPRSSAGSSAFSGDSACLPHKRIRCGKLQIAVGERRFDSASDALLAYLHQFEDNGTLGPSEAAAVASGDDIASAQNDHGPLSALPPSGVPNSVGRNGLIDAAVTGAHGKSKPSSSSSFTDNRVDGDAASVDEGGVKRGSLVGKGLAGSGLVLAPHGIAVAGTKEDVEDLLTSKVNPKLQEEVTDTLREVKLRRLLKQAALKSKNQSKTGLQQEVEAALIRSAELLEKVTREDIPSTKSAAPDVSLISSCNSSTLNIELEALLLGDSSFLGDEEEARSPLSPASTGDSCNKPGHTYSYRVPRPSRSRQRQSAALTDSQLSNSLQFQRCAPVSFHRRSRLDRRQRASSIDSLLPPQNSISASLDSTLQLLLNTNGSNNKKRDALCSPTSSDSVPSNQSDPTDLLRQIRSRSMSPGMRRRGVRSPRVTPGSPLLAPDWVRQLDESVRKSVPSWVGEMNSSEISDSLWIQEGLLEDENNRRPIAGHVTCPKVPSWVGKVGGSDINDEDDSHLTNTSGPVLVPMMSTPVKPMGDAGGGRWNTSIHNDNFAGGSDNVAGEDPLSNVIPDLTNDSRPGLNFSDLNTSAPRTPSNNGSSKHVTFTDSPAENHKRHSSSPASLLKKNGQTNSNTNNSNSSNNQARQGVSPHRPSRVLDSEYNGEAFLRNSILPQTARLKKSMDTFRASSENLRRRSVSSSGSSEASGGSGGKACSSLDTVALLTGRPLTRSQHVNGDGRSGQGQDHESSSDGLDGDRPWERLVNTIKAPVPVGAETSGQEGSKDLSPEQLENTLSGGRQPGSMEALKNMLFKLQAEETSTQDEAEQKKTDALDSSLQNASQTSMAVIPALENYDFKQEPGGHSLEKALVHLNRLKKLVKTAPASTAVDVDVKNSSSSNGISSDIS